MSLAVSTPKRSNSIHQKKRVGAHQKQTRSFVKTYYPYLPLFGLVIVGLAVAGGYVLGPTGAIFGGAGGIIASVAIVL
ncbi:MAG TPA: hypothetical protein VMR28_03480 [Candidatus Saccharimonadales bacterium]|nr:hypothetical protein [Candidatus Saccharimonadales bacterium]